MKITTREALEAHAVIPTVSQKKPPVKVGYALQRNLRRLREVAEDAEDQRQALVKQYGKEQKDGQVAVLMTDRESYEAYMSEWKSILAAQVDIEMHSVKLSEVKEPFDLTLGEIMSLYFMFEDDLS